MASHATAAPREPVLTTTTIVHVIAWLSAALAAVGLDKFAGWLTIHALGIAAVIVFVAPFVSAWLARRKTTPVAAPKDNDGNDLVPAGSTADTDAAAAAALAVAEEIFPAGAAQ